MAMKTLEQMVEEREALAAKITQAALAALEIERDTLRRALAERDAELEAAQAVVESTRGPFTMHAGYADAATCDCRRCTVTRARDAYDAAKAREAGE
jgi:hypothetical protein